MTQLLSALPLFGALLIGIMQPTFEDLNQATPQKALQQQVPLRDSGGGGFFAQANPKLIPIPPKPKLPPNPNLPKPSLK